MGCYRSCRVELFQFFSDAQTLRESRKQSTGVDDPSASKRCSSTPLHWKPHFSRMLREDGLVTRAPEIRCSTSNSSKVKSITARAGYKVLDFESLKGEIDHPPRRFGAKPLPPMLDAEPVTEFRRVRFAPV